jgi:spoIIIJ-associated protein
VEWVETTGRTLEEAKDAALDQLGVDESEAEFDVLEEPRTGLFGRVRGEARIRARVRPARPRPKTERRDRGRRRDKESKAEGNGKTAGERGARSGGDRTAARRARPAAGGREETAGNAARPDDREDGSSSSPSRSGAAGGASGSARSSDRRGRRGGSSGRGRGRDAQGSAPAGAGADDAEIDANGSGTVPAEGREMTDDDVTVEQQADLTEEFLSGLLGAFGVEGRVERTAVDEDTIEVQVAGEDLGLLIGPKGQTLLAVQDLARTFVQRKATGIHQGRVRIDVGGYRQRRREALQRFVRQVATEVQTSGMQKALEPMAAGDRKVVHDEVNLIEGVRTISEGEDPRRRVVIIPE